MSISVPGFGVCVLELVSHRSRVVCESIGMGIIGASQGRGSVRDSGKSEAPWNPPSKRSADHSAVVIPSGAKRSQVSKIARPGAPGYPMSRLGKPGGIYDRENLAGPHSARNGQRVLP